MEYRIQFLPAASKQFKGFPSRVQVRLRTRIDALAEDPRPPGCVKLSGERGIYRIRVGDYRVLYQVKDDEVVIIVVRVAQRKKAYEKSK